MADESFYTTDDTTGSAEFVEGTTTLATRMTFNVAGVIKAIRLYFPDVAPSGTVIGRLYPDSSGSALDSANFSASPTLGAFNLATLGTPYAVSSGTTLRVAIVTPNRYEAETNFFSGGPITRGNITAVDGRFASGDAFPGSSAVNTTYWADVVFEADSGASVAPSGIAVPVALGSPTTTVTLTGAPDGLAVPVALGSPAAAQALTVAPSGLAVPVALGATAVALPGAGPDGLAIPVALGAPTVAWSGSVAPAGQAIPVTLGSPRLPGGIIVRPDTGTITRPNTGIITRP